MIRDDRIPFRIPITGNTRFILQREFGGALVALAQDRTTPLYVLQGHGELSLTGDEACTVVLRELELAGFTPRPLNEPALDRLGRIPIDGVLLIPGAIHPLGHATIDKLSRYLRDGGAVFIAADWRTPDDLAIFLRRIGIIIAQGAVTNPADLLTDEPGPPGLVVNSVAFSLLGRDRRFDKITIDPEQHVFRFINHRRHHCSGKQLMMPLSTPTYIIDRAELANLDAELNQVQRVGQRPLPTLLPALLFGLRGIDGWLARAGDRSPPPPMTSEQAFHVSLGRALQFHPHAGNHPRRQRCAHCDLGLTRRTA